MRASGYLPALALIALATTAGAQVAAVAVDCNYDIHVRPLAWATLNATSKSLFPDTAYARMSARMAANEWLFLTDSIGAEVEKDPAIPPAERQVFLSQLRELREELRNAGAAARNAGMGVAIVRFRISAVPGGVEIFPDLAAPIDPALVPAQAGRRALCWRALTLSRMLSAYGAPARLAARTALEASEKRWDNFVEKGYSMYPWELAINSRRFSPSSQDPPQRQLVVLHPALSLELIAPSLNSLEHLQRLDAITVEPIGVLFYNEARTAYAGLSLLASLPGDKRVGLGVLAHLGTYGKIGGIFWRAKGADGLQNRSIVVSADLYQFLSGVPAKLRDMRTNALTAASSGVLKAVPQP